MSPLASIACQLLNGTLVHFQNIEARQTNSTVTTETTPTTLSPQTIALMVLSILFTLSELLASIPEVGANGIVQGILYYLKKGPGVASHEDVKTKIEQLRKEITDLVNATTSSSNTTAQPPNNTTTDVQNTDSSNSTPSNDSSVARLEMQIMELTQNLNKVMNAGGQNALPTTTLTPTPTPTPTPQDQAQNQNEFESSMPPGISQSHYVPHN